MLIFILKQHPFIVILAHEWWKSDPYGIKITNTTTFIHNSKLRTLPTFLGLALLFAALPGISGAEKMMV